MPPPAIVGAGIKDADNQRSCGTCCHSVTSGRGLDMSALDIA